MAEHLRGVMELESVHYLSYIQVMPLRSNCRSSISYSLLVELGLGGDLELKPQHGHQ